MAFPDASLDLRIEAAFGADLTASPLTWDWVDLTDRLRRSTLNITAGRPSEAGQVTPAQVAFALENLDGHLTPDNDASPWFPNVGYGTPVRVWAEGATPALVLDGTPGTSVTTPDHPDFDFAGDFDIRIRLKPDQWVGARTVDTRQTLVRKATTAGDDSFAAELLADGSLELRPSSDGVRPVVAVGQRPHRRVRRRRPTPLGGPHFRRRQRRRRWHLEGLLVARDQHTTPPTSPPGTWSAGPAKRSGASGPCSPPPPRSSSAPPTARQRSGG